MIRTVMIMIAALLLSLEREHPSDSFRKALLKVTRNMTLLNQMVLSKVIKETTTTTTTTSGSRPL
jgi:hypothetical protein